MGSRSLQFGGSAIRKAADEVIEKARRLAADALEASADDLELDVETGTWRVRGAAAAGSVSWAELAAEAEPRSCRRTCGSTSSHRRSPSAPTWRWSRWTLSPGSRAAAHRRGGRRRTHPQPRDLPGTAARRAGARCGAGSAGGDGLRRHGNPTTATLADYPFITATELPDFELVDMATPTDLNRWGSRASGRPPPSARPPRYRTPSWTHWHPRRETHRHAHDADAGVGGIGARTRGGLTALQRHDHINGTTPKRSRTGAARAFPARCRRTRGHQHRLRHHVLRRMHRAAGRRIGEVLHDAGGTGRRTPGHYAGGIGDQDGQVIRCGGVQETTRPAVRLLHPRHDHGGGVACSPETQAHAEAGA